MLMEFKAIYARLMEELFEAEMRRLNMVIVGINDKNKKEKVTNVDGFLYQGRFYIPRGVQVIRSSTAPALSFKLNAEMQQYVNDRAKVARDKDLIKQALAPVFMQANDKQELRDGLPDCLLAFVPEVAKLPRKMNSPDFLFGSNKFVKRSYESMLPVMEMYSVTKLFY